MQGGLLAIDCETALIDREHLERLPRLAVVQAFDGAICWLIHPGDASRFVLANPQAAYVGHNVAFDWWVVYHHLLRQDRQAAKLWLRLADDDRFTDTMLLDQLVRIAKGLDNGAPRDLATVAAQYTDAVLDKNDPWRLRYGETLGVNWNSIDRAAWKYAAADAIATRLAFIQLRNEARTLAVEESPFGPLSIRLQVKASIALAAITRRGIHIDRVARQACEGQLRARMNDLVQQLRSCGDFAGVLQTNKQGALLLTPAGKPRMSQKRLRRLLSDVAMRNELSPQKTPSGEVSLAKDFWQEHVDKDPFIGPWLQLEETAKLLQFFGKLQSNRIHPRYQTIVRTGRTSCSGPNVQQMPRHGGFREMFVPRDGHVFCIIDYSALELRTLAAVCLHKFGYSVLADTIRAGRDPHVYTAAMLEDAEYERFLHQGSAQLKQKRQVAKAVNFGVPGGLGPNALARYAAATYGVQMSVDQATEFRDRFLDDIYPEIGEYLADDDIAVVAGNLQCSDQDVVDAFRTAGTFGAAKKLLLGEDGGYSPSFENRLWQTWRELCANRDLQRCLRSQNAGRRLYASICHGRVTTSTGRVRGNASYTQRRNTPFQALAADGAKLAAWRLFREGFRVVAFIHDEFVVELKQSEDLGGACDRIRHICCEEMESVCNEVPIECELALADCWSKQAELVRDQEGRIQIWRANPCS